MTCEPGTPDGAPTAASAAPPAGAIQRVAAETLEVLADHLGEHLTAYRPGQFVGTSLLDLLACHAEYAADAHQIPWNPWIRDGIETAALLGLSLAGVSSRWTLLPREQLARRFALLSTRGQMAWLLHAADLLHRTADPGAYGPPIGESPTREALRAGDPPATQRLAAEPAPPTRIDHAHEQGLYIQLLPACLAPTDADRAAQLSFGLPHEGDPVVIARRQVIWLTAYGTAAEVTEATTQLWGAPVIGEGCGAARRDPDSVTALDPSYVGLLDREVEAIQTAWTLLIDLANRFPAGGRSR